MRKFILKIVLLTMPIIISLLFFVNLINTFSNNNALYKIDNSVNILILGNSHPECALNDSLIDKSINLSQSADSYFYTYYKLKKLIDANPNIQTVVLEYTNNAFLTDMDKWVYGEEYLGAKYPKYSQLINLNDNFFLFYKNPTAYLTAFKDALKLKYAIRSKNKILVYKELRWGGYLFLVRDKIPLIKKDYQKEKFLSAFNLKKISTLNILNLKKIAIFCKERNLKLILFRSPLHQLYPRIFEKEFTELLKSDLQNISFWDYSNYPMEDFEFGDLEHLNYIGARRFSKVINLRLNGNSGEIAPTFPVK